jgi:hypothetical protein
VGITDGKRALEVAVSVLKQIHLNDESAACRGEAGVS